MITKDQRLLTEAYQTIRETQSLKESDSLNSIVNVGLANFYKKYLVEYTVGNRPPAGMDNVNISGSDATNIYKPVQSLSAITPSGDTVTVVGSEREMAIEERAIETSRALLIFLTFARLDAVVRYWLTTFKLKDKTLNLTSDEEAELDSIIDKVKQGWRGNFQYPDTDTLLQNKEVVRKGLQLYLPYKEEERNTLYKRYLELTRKKEATSEFVVPLDRLEQVRQIIIRRMKRLTNDPELNEEIEDIVDFMINFLANNPNQLELLDLPKYKQSEEPPSEDSPSPIGGGHNHDGPGGISNVLIQALPGIAELAIHILGIGGAAALGAGAAIGAIVVKKSQGLIKTLKDAPRKMLALIQGAVRPALPAPNRPALPDKPRKDENKPDGWEIEVSDGKWEPIAA